MTLRKPFGLSRVPGHHVDGLVIPGPALPAYAPVARQPAGLCPIPQVAVSPAEEAALANQAILVRDSQLRMRVEQFLHVARVDPGHAEDEQHC